MTNTLAQRARELLAEECRANGFAPLAPVIEGSEYVSAFCDTALRAIEAALRLSAGEDWVSVDAASNQEKK